MTLRGSVRPPGTHGVDLRTAEGRLMARTRHRLTQHVGQPTATQAALIERAVMLTAHLAKMDAEALRTGFRDLERYLSLNGALTRTLDKLGTKPKSSAPETKPESTLAELIERLSA